MSNEVAIRDNDSIKDIENINQVVHSLMKLPHYQKMGIDNIVAIVSKAKSLNIDYIYALNGGLFSLKGKIGMPAETMAAMIREKGHSITKDKASNDTCCILHGKRADNGDTWTVKFTLEDAKRAGIYANVWEKYPGPMCYNRAMSFLARQLFPDVIRGAGYTPDEIREIVRSNGDDLQPSEDVKEVITKDQANEIVALLDNCTVEYQDKVLRGLKNLPAPVNSIYELPVELFDRIKNAAILNAKKVEPAKEVSYQDAKDGEVSNEAV